MSVQLRPAIAAVATLILGSILAACGGSAAGSVAASADQAPSAPAAPSEVSSAAASPSAAASEVAASASTASGGSTTSSSTFVYPFGLSLPAWVTSTPDADGHDFVTWLSPTEDRAIRVLHPVAVYQPGSTTAGPVPDDYQTYFEGLTGSGMVLEDKATTTVGGHPATLYTVTTTTSLDGVWGCPAPGLAADVCYGAQPELAVRLALVDMDGQPLLIWVRAANDGDNTTTYADFETMLKSVAFR